MGDDRLKYDLMVIVADKEACSINLEEVANTRIRTRRYPLI